MGRLRAPTAPTLALTVAVVLASCGGDGPMPSISEPTNATATALPSAAPPSDSEGASPSGTPVPSAAGGEATTGGHAQVVADALRMRSAAGTDAQLVGELRWGSLVTIESPATEADGFTWYEVSDLSGTRGWVAAGDGADDWLLPGRVVVGGERLIEFTQACDVVGPVRRPTTTILADGTVIMQPWIELETARLTAEGLAAIREQIVELPYLQQDGDYQAVRLPGAEPPGHGACTYTFEVGPDPDPVTVTSVSWFGDEEEAEFWQPSPERRALSTVAQNLADIGSVIGEDLWAEPPLPYLATEYTVWLSADLGPAVGESVPVEDVDLGASPDDFGEPVRDRRCAVVPRDTVAGIARAFRDAGQEVTMQDFSGGQLHDESGQGYNLMIVPRSPLGAPGCDDLN